MAHLWPSVDTDRRPFHASRTETNAPEYSNHTSWCRCPGMWSVSPFDAHCCHMFTIRYDRRV